VTVDKPLDNWRDWVVYFLRLSLIAVVGYGFSIVREQWTQNYSIQQLQQQVAELRAETKELNRQHSTMIGQLAALKQQVEDFHGKQTNH